MTEETFICRHFLTYSGVKLPLNLLNELSAEQIGNRNTYFRGYFDAANRLRRIEKIVYGEVEMEHRYAYHANGVLQRVEITDAEEESNVLEFDETGLPVED